MQRTPSSLALLLAPALLLGGLGIAQAADDLGNIVQHRQEIMKSLKEDMSALKKSVKDNDAQAAATQAEKIQRRTENLTELFPPGSNVGDSEAKPEIWKRWADFEKIANSIPVKASTLAKAAASGDPSALQSALTDVGNTCKSCHKDFRSE
jgi:cytochrome c556